MDKSPHVWNQFQDTHLPGRPLVTILKGSGTAFIIQSLGAFISFTLQVLLARWLGQEAYGNFAYAYNWAQVLAVFGTCGLTISILRFLPRFIATKDWGRARGVLSVFLRVTFIFSLGLAILVMLIFFLFPQEGLNQMVLFLGLSLTPLIALKDLRTESIRSSDYIGLAYSPPYILQPLLVITTVLVIMSLTGRVLPGEAIAALAFSLLTVIAVQAGILRQVLPHLKLAKPINEARAWLQPTPSLLLVQGAQVIISRADILTVGLLLGAAEVGVYSAATRAAYLISFVLVSVNAVIAPRIAPLYIKRDREGLQAMVSTGTRLSAALAMAASIVMIAFSRQVLELFGEGFMLAQVSLAILVMGQLVNAATGPVGYLMHLTGHQAISARIYSVAALLSVLLNLSLIPRFGLPGAAIATSFATIGQNVAFYVCVRRVLRIDPLGIWIIKGKSD